MFSPARLSTELYIPFYRSPARAIQTSGQYGVCRADRKDNKIVLLLMMNKKFKLPTKSDLKSRASTISNAFAIAITPYIYPSEEEISNFLTELCLKQGQCAYCLGKANARDHVKPLVKNGLPTGYKTEIRNLVPCCSACNSAKGAQDFATWYKSAKNVAKLHLEGLTDTQIEERFEVISR